MTATLTFTMPDDRDAHTLAVHALDLYCVMCDLRDAMRTALKHGHKWATPDAAIEGLRDVMEESMRDHGVSTDMVS